MDKRTSRFALILGAAALWKIGTQSSQVALASPIVATPSQEAGLPILRGTISDTIAPSTPIISTYLDTDLIGFNVSNFNNAGSRIVDKPYRQLGMRVLVDQPLFDAASDWTFIAIVYKASNGLLYFVNLAKVTITSTTARIVDSGLHSLPDSAVPFQELEPGADIVSIQLFGTNMGLAPQTVLGYAEVYGSI